MADFFQHSINVSLKRKLIAIEQNVQIYLCMPFQNTSETEDAINVDITVLQYDKQIIILTANSCMLSWVKRLIMKSLLIQCIYKVKH